MSITLTANFTPEEVENIVKKYLITEGYEVLDISTQMGISTVGVGLIERDETIFKGIEAKIKKKPEPIYSQFDR